MNAFFARLKEPSTWAGLSMLATMFGVPSDHVSAVSGVVAAIGAAAAVFLPEKTAAKV